MRRRQSLRCTTLDGSTISETDLRARAAHPARRRGPANVRHPAMSAGHRCARGPNGAGTTGDIERFDVRLRDERLEGHSCYWVREARIVARP